MSVLVSSAREVAAAPSEAPDRGADLRAPALGLVTWAGSLLGLLTPPAVAIAVLALAVVPVAVLLVRVRRGRAVGVPAGTLLVATLLLLVASGVAGVHRGATSSGPVAALAEAGASVRGEVVVTSDPRVVEGTYGDIVLLRGDLVELSARGRAWELRSDVLLMASTSWSDVDLGARVAVAGRLLEADGDLAGLLRVRGAPEVRAAPDLWWDGAAAVRAALRESVDHRPADQAVLVPSLVVGDDAGLDPELAEDFATTGLTHLLAVSGTNLTLIVGFLLVLARWVGVRGRGSAVVAAFGIVGFVLLARTEPSVVRAAAMGTVALVGLGRNGLQRGTRSLGVAVVVLLLVWPWLAVTVGFALSVLATGGILFLAPRWRDALATWMPRPVAEAIAVPAAAQLACTPVVAAISGEVSLVAVVANMLVAPVVGPATVLGLAGGLLGLVSTLLSRVPGTLASWCVGWIITVARWGAELPTASVGWGTSVVAVAALTVVCVLAVPLGTRVLRSRVLTGVVCLATGAVVLVGVPDPGWPPRDWAVVACDVGQGDGLVLRAAEGVAVVVDTGNDEAALQRCLDDLGVRHVPLLVLTHFHDDHAGAVGAVLAGRVVDAIEVSPLAEPAAMAAEVQEVAARAGVPVGVAAHGSRRVVGDVTLEVLWPEPGPVRGGSGGSGGSGERDGEGSGANDASIVVVATVRDVSVLLTGDIEPPAQRRILAGLRSRPDPVDVDVLKVPHHGSRHQELDLLLAVRPEVALVSVGADNTYGHPDEDLLRALDAAGTAVFRTDLSGDVAVLSGEAGADDPGVRVVPRRP